MTLWSEFNNDHLIFSINQIYMTVKLLLSSSHKILKNCISCGISLHEWAFYAVYAHKFSNMYMCIRVYSRLKKGQGAKG